jgi:hypothetical protein
VSKDGLFNAPVTLQSQDGNVLLDISKGTAGRIGEDKIISSITVTQINMPELAAPPAGQNIISADYNFEPSGAIFTPALSMTFHYDPSSIHSGADLLVDYFDTVLQQWVNLPDFVIDASNNAITVQVAHFTTFAVLEQVPEVPAVLPALQPTATTPTPAPTPSATPTAAPASTPEPTSAAAPVITATLPSTPALPQAAAISIPERKTVNTLWIIAIAALLAVMIISASYSLVRRRKKFSEAREETVEPAEEDNPNTSQYSGTVKLMIGAPIDLSQMQALMKCLRQSPDLRVESTGGSADEGNNIVISIDKNKPVLLVEFLRAMPPVKQVTTRNGQIVITLQPPPAF